MSTRKEAGVPPGMTVATFVMILGMASISSALAETVTKLPLRAGAKEVLAKDAAFRDAVTTALGKDVRYVAASASGTDNPKKAALTLSIEDKDLAPVPSAVAAAVKRDRTGSGSCRLIGKPILPSVSTKLPTYFVTTADACDWGAALGPIWVVAAGDGKGTVVLSSGGYWVKVHGEVTTGFHNLVVGRETASERVTNEYVYNGGTYNKVQ